MNEPLISVVVPTYKRKPSLIERSIKSILEQTYENIELIIVDDSPPDYEYRDMVKEYIQEIKDDRIQLIRHKTNLGANKARNTGIQNSNGEFVAFLDDDDEWMLDKLELQVQPFEDSEIALVYCRAVIIEEETGRKRPIINEIRTGNHYKDLLKQNFIGSNSFVLIRKNVLNEVGLYDEELLSNQDYDLFLRIAKKYKITGIDKVLVKYNVHEGERISTNHQKQFQGRVLLGRKHSIDINKDDELSIIWKIKEIPLFFKIGKKRQAIFQLLRIALKHPVYVAKYSLGTLNYMKRKKKYFE